MVPGVGTPGDPAETVFVMATAKVPLAKVFHVIVMVIVPIGREPLIGKFLMKGSLVMAQSVFHVTVTAIFLIVRVFLMQELLTKSSPIDETASNSRAGDDHSAYSGGVPSKRAAHKRFSHDSNGNRVCYDRLSFPPKAITGQAQYNGYEAYLYQRD